MPEEGFPRDEVGIVESGAGLCCVVIRTSKTDIGIAERMFNTGQVVIDPIGGRLTLHVE